jgi:hypothetical protein
MSDCLNGAETNAHRFYENSILPVDYRAIAVVSLAFLAANPSKRLR